MELSRWRKAGACVSGAILIALAVAGCSNTPKPESEFGQGGRTSPATPGSARDFAVNVGDIVYFTTDSVDLSPEATATPRVRRDRSWSRRGSLVGVGLIPKSRPGRAGWREFARYCCF